MPRINIKGGVWRNSEDEILKAAVMKYGKNQWARIASLLHRKSAKQCKARWYEWLDPSIKKTEWSREEDEKLVHMAKLMPTQWRTIAPVVGRTATQCLERYEFLIDKAQMRDEGGDDDPRRLRPGEIDPCPENKPAQPDAIDMDEDELEMLSEARARLANTQGKKAKRKAREKQLEEARRLASLQKRRELRAAGIFTRVHRVSKKKFPINYNEETPFEKQPPVGFHDVSGEDAVAPKARDFKTLQLADIERKSFREKEQEARQKDKERAEKRKTEDLPGLLAQRTSAFTEPAVKRSKLVLPSPQLEESEIRQAAKLGAHARDLAEESARTGLTAGIGETPRTELRTPATSVGGAGGTAAAADAADQLASLKDQLANLPKPKNDFELMEPEDEAEADAAGNGVDLDAEESEAAIKEDQADADRRREEERRRAEAEAWARRSEPVRRGLPVPSECNTSVLRRPDGLLELQRAEELVKAEALKMIKYDIRPNDPAAALAEQFDQAELAQAAELLEAEKRAVADGMQHGRLTAEAYCKVWDECLAQVLYLPQQGRYTRANLASKKERIESLDNALNANRNHMNLEARQAAKLERKLKVLLGGYQARAKTLAKQLAEGQEALDQAAIELETYQRLRQHELGAIASRLESLEDDVQRQCRRESELQTEYDRLRLRLDALRLARREEAAAAEAGAPSASDAAATAGSAS
ncbi:hypothetical protein BOX15_Mlig003770g1 [Macrostomum lignano]|uniref:Uncharacterized protein n=2 Tax=Macrostomum lignano TaxID=282301 RepID=A0A267H443_9PLAT|nr:hypothetical protein BOX15_Mlig003770g1 [Macrostomum lignano]